MEEERRGRRKEEGEGKVEKGIGWREEEEIGKRRLEGIEERREEE